MEHKSFLLECTRYRVETVRLETATDDLAAALPNYLASGYRIVEERDLLQPMPPGRTD